MNGSDEEGFNFEENELINQINDIEQQTIDGEFFRNITLPQRIIQNVSNYTAKQFRTLQKQSMEQTTNNIPTVMGKNFQKYLKYLKKQQNVKIPDLLENFISKQKEKVGNQKRKSVSFALADFNQFLECEKSKQFFQFFLKHCALNYFLQSNKIQNPLLMIQYIEFYLASTYQTVPYINQNRQFNKNVKKKEKVQLNIVQSISSQNNIIEDQYFDLEQNNNQVYSEIPFLLDQ